MVWGEISPNISKQALFFFFFFTYFLLLVLCSFKGNSTWIFAYFGLSVLALTSLCRKIS